MADIRIKDLGTTASVTASDDFMAVDGTTNGTRKLSAAAPAFLTSVTTPSLTSPASTDLTLAAGGTNQNVVLTPSGTGNVGIGTTTPSVSLEIKTSASTTAALRLTDGNNRYAELRKTSSSNSIELYNSLANTLILSADESGTKTSLMSGNVLIGTTSDTGLTGVGGLKINSTTAGSAGAGALVIAGGLAAAGASYFGGAVTCAGNVTIGGTSAISGVRTTTTTINFGTIATNDASSVSTITMSGVTVGGTVIVNRNDTADQFPKFCVINAYSGADSVFLRLYNPNSASVTLGSVEIRVTVINF
jgi:hypothetical protein